MPVFICSFIHAFIHLKANICRGVSHQAAPLRCQSGRYLLLRPALCGCRFHSAEKTPEVQRDGLLFSVYEFRGLKLQGSFCFILIFHQSTFLKLCMFCFPDGAAEE